MTKEQNTKGKPTDIDAHVGGVLRSLRNAAKLSQVELARAVGITFQQIQKYESGKNRVAAGKLYEFAQYLGVSITTFFPGEEGESEMVQRLKDEVAQLRELISWTSQNLKDSLKKGALDK